MKPQTIQRVKDKTGNFTIVDNEAFRRSDLSLRAKGLLAYLLTFSDNWQIYKSAVYKDFTDGKYSVDGAFRELEEKGYITKEVNQGKDGKLRGWNYKVYEQPTTQNTEDGKNRNRLNPHSVNQQLRSINPTRSISNNNVNSANERRTHDVVFNYYNESCPSLPRAIKLTDKRRGHINAVVKEFGEEGVMEAFAKVESCPHLVGNNDRGWKADFDWLINMNNLLKVIEGRYDQKKKIKEGDDGYYDNDIAW